MEVEHINTAGQQHSSFALNSLSFPKCRQPGSSHGDAEHLWVAGIAPALAVMAELVQSSSYQDVQWSRASLDRDILGSSGCPLHSWSPLWVLVLPAPWQVCADPGAPVFLIRWPHAYVREVYSPASGQATMPFHLCSPPISNFFPYLCRKTNARSKIKLELMFHPFLIPAGLRLSLPRLLWELSCTVPLGWAIPPSDSGPQTSDTQALPSGGQGQSAAALKS